MLESNDLVGFGVSAGGIITINTASGTTNIQGYSMIARDVVVANGHTVLTIGIYSTIVNATFKVKLVKRNSANNYDVVVNQAVSHGGTGWEDFALTAPYTVPQSGTYYLAAYQNTTLSNTVAAGAARAYVVADISGAGAVTTGEDAGGTNYPLRYTFF